MQTGLCVTGDGSVLIDRRTVAIPNIHIESVIGEGANGVVFMGTHQYLQRVVALKIWLRMRDQDRRDKFHQGILEAQKASAADGSKHVVAVHEAGAVEGIFYAVMEYFDGITLSDWIDSYKASLAERSRLAWRIALVASELAAIGIVHGDLHAKNVLVKRGFVGPSDFRDFKLVDFGTSLFARDRASSIQRHWSTLEETVNRLTHPFHIARLKERPRTMDARQMQWWYLTFFRDLPFYLQILGAEWLERQMPGRRHDDEDPMNTLTADTRSELMRLLDNKTLELTPEYTGDSFSWNRIDSGWVDIAKEISRNRPKR